jgi:hypothetical protein
MVDVSVNPLKIRMFIHILSNTPKWVFVLFFTLLVLGRDAMPINAWATGYIGLASLMGLLVARLLDVRYD